MRRTAIILLTAAILIAGCAEPVDNPVNDTDNDTEPTMTDDGCMGYDDPCDYSNPGNVINPINPANPIMMP